MQFDLIVVKCEMPIKHSHLNEKKWISAKCIFMHLNTNQHLHANDWNLSASLSHIHVDLCWFWPLLSGIPVNLNYVQEVHRHPIGIYFASAINYINQFKALSLCNVCKKQKLCAECSIHAQFSPNLCFSPFFFHLTLCVFLFTPPFGAHIH